jgi:hypothetical protein
VAQSLQKQSARRDGTIPPAGHQDIADHLVRITERTGMTTRIDRTSPREHSGMDRLVEKYRRQFRIPENYDHYSEDDYQSAERQYLRFCLKRGCG